jgi:hypothetical protein
MALPPFCEVATSGKDFSIPRFPANKQLEQRSCTHIFLELSAPFPMKKQPIEFPIKG